MHAEQVIPVSSVKSLLHVVLFDHDMLSANEYLGEVIVSLDHLSDSKMHDDWYRVQAPPSYSGEVTGCVRLEMQLSGNLQAWDQSLRNSFLFLPCGTTTRTHLAPILVALG